MLLSLIVKFYMFYKWILLDISRQPMSLFFWTTSNDPNYNFEQLIGIKTYAVKTKRNNLNNF